MSVNSGAAADFPGAAADFPGAAAERWEAAAGWQGSCGGRCKMARNKGDFASPLYIVVKRPFHPHFLHFPHLT